MSVAQAVQADFSAGMVRAVARHLIPENGVYDLENHLLDNDGGTYKRGGSKVLSTANFGSSGLRMLWDGELLPGHRTFYADSADFGVLDGSNAPLNLGGAGVTAPSQCAVIGDILFVGGGTMYGGSWKTSNYSTGTISISNGSKTLTGAGTAWLANVDVGMLFRVSGQRVYVVASVDSDTQITLNDAFAGTTIAGSAYTLKAIETTSAPYITADFYAVAGERLVACSGSNANFSNFQNPHVFSTNDVHAVPGGVRILGCAGARNTASYFTTGGVWESTNMHLELVDDFGNPQQQLQSVSRDLILWSGAGIASWASGLVVPMTDGVWIIGEKGFEKVSKSISSLYASHVRAGYHTGQSDVINGTLFLPILNSSENVVDHLVCRLDRPTRVRGQIVYPWGRVTGAGANVTAVTKQVSATSARQPKLLGASRQATGAYVGRVLDLSDFFNPSASVKNDHDGTTPRWMIETRDFPTGRLNVNLVKYLRGTYRMTDSGSDNPKIAAQFSTGAISTATSIFGVSYFGVAYFEDDVGAEFYPIVGSAPEDDGRLPFLWRLRGAKARTRYIRFRLTCDHPVADLQLRSLELFTRPNGRF